MIVELIRTSDCVFYFGKGYLKMHHLDPSNQHPVIQSIVILGQGFVKSYSSYKISCNIFFTEKFAVQKLLTFYQHKKSSVLHTFYSH